MNRISLALKALGELGIRQVSLYALYKIQLYSGYLYRRTADDRRFTDLPEACFLLYPLTDLPQLESLRTILEGSGCNALLSEADEILAGRVRLFGGDPVPLKLESDGLKRHWTELEKHGLESKDQDIKWIWEAGRFGWAIVLGRAYWLTGDERYAVSFWNYLETFLDANPPYRGAQWMSAQEAALRLIAITFAAQAFAGSSHSTSSRIVRLGRAIAAHAGRIPPSMMYARAQNNNHLLSEAAGLYTAGLALLDHPEAANWRRLGWQCFHEGLASQVSADGGYTQNSTNYHRLMLQLALWIAAISRKLGQDIPEKTHQRLASATHWLQDLLDPETGGVPNLGPNDGAYILPLATGLFSDYRPVVQAASGQFLGGPCLSPGKWDEMGLWLGIDQQHKKAEGNVRSAVGVVRLNRSWAYLRAARFSSRPGHADQLHVDLWWHGINLAFDPGSYLYNALPPWDNAFSRTRVHNTVTVNDLDQMTYGGRFLWLDWAQAAQSTHEEAPDGSWVRRSAEHDGYRRLGVFHKRTLTGYREGRWLVEDALIAHKQRSDPGKGEFSARLHWLMPDWPWALKTVDQKIELVLESLHGEVMLSILSRRDDHRVENIDFCLVRAGEILSGKGPADPVRGWYSPTYGYKYPALSLSYTVKGPLPINLESEWRLPGAKG